LGILSVEARHVVKINSFAFWYLDGFNFVVNISEWSVIAYSGVHTLVVTISIQDDTGFLFWLWWFTTFWEFAINSSWNDPRSVSGHEVPLLDISLESWVLLVGISGKI